MRVLGLFVVCLSARFADEAPEAAAYRTLDTFLNAFNANDAAAWADTLHFPHVRMASGTVAVYPDKASFVAAMDLERFAIRSILQRFTPLGMLVGGNDHHLRGRRVVSRSAPPEILA